MTHYSEVLRQSVAASNRPVQFELPFDSRRRSASCLANPRVVTVESVQHITVSVVARREKRSSHSRASTAERVYVNGKRVGLYDCLGALAWHEMPTTIRGVRLKLSDGQECTVYNRALTVVERWESKLRDNGEKYWYPHKVTLMAVAVDLRLGRRLTWSVASSLAAGDAATIEYAFQWVNGELTNGVISLPPERPQGQDWREYPIPQVDEPFWADFLDGLEGKLLHELLPFHLEVVSRKPEQRPMTQRQTAVARVVSGAMWKGVGCERVSFGRNMLFIHKRQAAEPLYVVDNPGVGAVYVFAGDEDARSFATGAITRQTAIKAGCRRVVHAGAWEKRLTELLAAM